MVQSIHQKTASRCVRTQASSIMEYASMSPHFTANCEYCNSPFEQIRLGQRFCRPYCAHTAWRKKKKKIIVIKQCARCGTDFVRISSNHRFCNKQCQQEYERESRKRLDGPGKSWRKGKTFTIANRVCLQCNNPFHAPDTYVRRGHALFCSRLCYAEHKKAQDRLRIEMVCAYCSKPFLVHPCHVERAKFCSKSCKHNSLKKTPFICPVCGGDNPSRGTTYCSKECRDKKRIPPVKAEIICANCGKKAYVRPIDIKNGYGKFCSRKCWRMHKSHTAEGTHSRAHGGKRADLDNRYFRSGWEANYARYLNWLITQGQIVSWEYEADTFEFHKIKKGIRFYTPDFKILNNDGTYEYHEIKGYMDDASATKLKRMARYYPDTKLILIQKDEYREISKWKRLFPEWE